MEILSQKWEKGHEAGETALFKSTDCSSEDLGSIYSTHTVAHNHLELQPQGSDTLFCPLQAPSIYMVNRHTQETKYIFKINNHGVCCCLRPSAVDSTRKALPWSPIQKGKWRNERQVNSLIPTLFWFPALGNPWFLLSPQGPLNVILKQASRASRKLQVS